MALTVCDNPDCRTLLAVGLSRCPHCHSTDLHEFGSRPVDEEHPMSPKIVRNRAPAEVPVEESSDQGSDVTEPADAATAGEVARPVVNDPKRKWVAYAVALGFDRAEAESYTKAQLIDALNHPGDDTAEEPDRTGGDEDDDIEPEVSGDAEDE